jgi:hypothetical protein
MKQGPIDSYYSSLPTGNRGGRGGRRSHTTSFEEPIPEQMPEDSASRPDSLADACSAEPLPELESAELTESKDTAHSPRLVRVRWGHIVLTSPLPVVSPISAQGQMTTQSTPTPSSARVEQGGSLEASVGRAAAEPSTSKPSATPNSPGHTSHSAPNQARKVPPVDMSDGSSYSSTGDARENIARESSNPPNTQSPVTRSFLAAISSIPILPVQQPTRDPSQTRSEVTPEDPVEPQIAEVFVRVPLRRDAASSDITTSAPDIPVTVTERPGRAAIPWQVPTPGSHVASVKSRKTPQLLRKCRNRLATESLLNVALGRSVAKVTKPALRLAANPTDAVLAFEEAESIANSEPPVRKGRIVNGLWVS